MYDRLCETCSSTYTDKVIGLFGKRLEVRTCGRILEPAVCALKPLCHLKRARARIINVAYAPQARRVCIQGAVVSVALECNA